MNLKGSAYIAGAFEHPTRRAPDKSVAQLHAECAKGALEDAGLTKRRRRRLFLRGRRARHGPALDGRLHGPARAARGRDRYRRLLLSDAWSPTRREAIAAGSCEVALITLAGRPRSEGVATGTAPARRRSGAARDAVRVPVRARPS